MSSPHPVQTSPIADALPPLPCEVAGAGVDGHVASVAAPRVVTRAGVAPGHAGAGPSLSDKMDNHYVSVKFQRNFTVPYTRAFSLLALPTGAFIHYYETIKTLWC